MFDSVINTCFFSKPNVILVPAEDEAFTFPECDYDRNPTPLYKAIENKQWVSVHSFLSGGGKWPGSFFNDPVSPKDQLCTWVTRYEIQGLKRKKVNWTHLPIHAAIIYGAPEQVIDLMIRIAPPTIRCADDQRMLPLHLAFRGGSSDNVVVMLLDGFPEATNVRDFKNRTPAECATEGPGEKRGHIISAILNNHKKQWEKKKDTDHNKEMSKTKKELREKSKQADEFKAAFEQSQSKDERTRKAFTLVVTELKAVSNWYNKERKSMEDSSLNAELVKNMAKKLASLEMFADKLTLQFVEDVDLEDLSDASATESSTDVSESGSQAEADVMENQSVKGLDVVPRKKDEFSQAKVKKEAPEETPVEEEEPSHKKEVPDVVSVEVSEDSSVQQSLGVSEMTPLEFDEQDAAKYKKTMKKLKNSFRKTKSKGDSTSSITSDIQRKAKKKNKMLSKMMKGNLKATPTM